METFISIIHPSRGRPLEADKTIVHWMGNCLFSDKIEYVLSVDIDDRFINNYKRIAKKNGIKILINNNKSAIAAINYAAHYTKGSIIIVASDDFGCEQDWDLDLLKALEGKEDYLVKTKDGIQPTLITLPIMDRTYYNRFGYIYHPDYKHMFSDQEMTTVGHFLGKVITLDLLFEHHHYSTGKSKKDLVNIKNDKTWNQGKRMFNARLSINFGIENPVIKYNQIVWR